MLLSHSPHPALPLGQPCRYEQEREKGYEHHYDWYLTAEESKCGLLCGLEGWSFEAHSKALMGSRLSVTPPPHTYPPHTAETLISVC